MHSKELRIVKYGEPLGQHIGGLSGTQEAV